MGEKKSGQFLTILILGLALASPLRAQFWQKKDYLQWSQRECQKLLTDSPWATGYTVGTVLFQPVAEESAVPVREMNPQIVYQAQIWSARPIRQALVRLMRLDPKFSQLSPEQKQARETEWANFIDAEFPDAIVIRVRYSANDPVYDRDLARFWQSQSTDSLRQDIYLSSSGKVIPVRVTVAPGAAREIELIFPRELDGRPFVRPTDKTLTLEFTHPAVGILPSERVFLRFDARKMRVNEKIVY